MQRVHTLQREHGSPPPPAPVAALAAAAASVVGTGVAAIGGTVAARIGVVQRDDSPPRGPRTLLLRRGENGFGFTLRHFIVYPPESCCVSKLFYAEIDCFRGPIQHVTLLPPLDVARPRTNENR